MVADYVSYTAPLIAGFLEWGKNAVALVARNTTPNRIHNPSGMNGVHAPTLPVVTMWATVVSHKPAATAARVAVR